MNELDIIIRDQANEYGKRICEPILLGDVMQAYIDGVYAAFDIVKTYINGAHDAVEGDGR